MEEKNVWLAIGLNFVCLGAGYFYMGLRGVGVLLSHYTNNFKGETMKNFIAMATTAIMMLTICSTVFAEPQKMIELIAENNVNLVGQLVVAEDEGNEGMVKYRAIRLKQPVIIKHEDGESEVNTVTLWFNDKKQEAIFKKLQGKSVQAVGTLHYYWNGPRSLSDLTLASNRIGGLSGLMGFSFLRFITAEAPFFGDYAVIHSGFRPIRLFLNLSGQSV